MKICMVSSEAVPFAKSGGLADVVGTLSASLADDGHDVRICLPLYASISVQALKPAVSELKVPIGFGTEKIEVLEGSLSSSEVPVYFIKHPLFSKRPGLYGHDGSHPYRDNHLRFGLFCRAVFFLCKQIDWIPDILHSHDWQTALISGYMREYEMSGYFHNTKSVFTIHNIGYQGIFSKHDLHTLQLSWEVFHSEETPANGSLNFMKCGLLNADAITTVSPTYAREIQTPEFGHGMESYLRERSAILYGILNGADYSEWDPAGDPHIPAAYSAENRSGKIKAKTALQKKVGLPVSSEVPLIGLISRLAAQKGFYELCDPHRGALKRICQEMAVQVVVLGTGETWIEEELEKFQKELPNLKVLLTFSNSLAHLIEAGSDFFLMPSRYEPCGLNQIYSLRYGALPIVRNTGGLADTVRNYKPGTSEGTGFMFDDISPESIFHTTEWAVSTWYEHPEEYRILQKRAMEQHFSWTDSAQEYIRLFERLLE